MTGLSAPFSSAQMPQDPIPAAMARKTNTVPQITDRFMMMVGSPFFLQDYGTIATLLHWRVP